MRSSFVVPNMSTLMQTALAAAADILVVFTRGADTEQGKDCDIYSRNS
jgi:hypothetical protein